MKKLLIISALALLVVMMAVPAFAATGGTDPALTARTHGGFSSTSEACAGCHTTHAATAAKLLAFGGDTTAFCNVCHNDPTKSPYETDAGKSQTFAAGYTWSDAPAGGFTTTYSGANTSVHILGGTVVPGGTSNLTGAFTCGSCHDPHAGAATIEGGNRLLKADPGPVANGVLPAMIIDGTSKLTTNYKSGFSKWCGSCHDMLDAGTNSGSTAYNTAATNNENMYRHATDVLLAAGAVNVSAISLGFDKTLNAGTPLEVGADNAVGGADDKLSCISCHRAHGTKAIAATTYGTFNVVKGAAGTNSGSVLLRMDRRGVCYNCHGAATANLPD